MTMNFTHMQKEILRAIAIHGGITPEMTNRHGWTTHGGLPTSEMNQLIREYRIVAPRVLTSQPLRIVWQFRKDASNKEVLAKIEKEAQRLGMKEYAKDNAFHKGGFQLTLRKELGGRG